MELYKQDHFYCVTCQRRQEPAKQHNTWHVKCTLALRVHVICRLNQWDKHVYCMTPFSHHKQNDKCTGYQVKYKLWLLILICSSRGLCLATQSSPLGSNCSSLMIKLFINLIIVQQCHFITVLLNNINIVQVVTSLSSQQQVMWVQSETHCWKRVPFLFYFLT